MKYKLLKDFPEIEAGTVFERVDDSRWKFDQHSQIHVARCSPIWHWLEYAAKYPEWFERIEDKPTRWRANQGEQYYYLEEDRTVGSSTEGVPATCAHIDDRRYANGNYYRTHEQAEAVAEAIKALLTWIYAPAGKEAAVAYDLLEEKRVLASDLMDEDGDE